MLPVSLVALCLDQPCVMGRSLYLRRQQLLRRRQLLQEARYHPDIVGELSQRDRCWCCHWCCKLVRFSNPSSSIETSDHALAFSSRSHSSFSPCVSVVTVLAVIPGPSMAIGQMELPMVPEPEVLQNEPWRPSPCRRSKAISSLRVLSRVMHHSQSTVNNLWVCQSTRVNERVLG
jgi:hypothetical protein